MAGEYLGRDGGIVGLQGTFETFGGSGPATFRSISLLEVGGDCLSSLVTAAVILTRLGFLARSLVGYNPASKWNTPDGNKWVNEGREDAGKCQVYSKYGANRTGQR